jgi:hypothetical protein
MSDENIAALSAARETLMAIISHAGEGRDLCTTASASVVANTPSNSVIQSAIADGFRTVSVGFDVIVLTLTDLDEIIADYIARLMG